MNYKYFETLIQTANIRFCDLAGQLSISFSNFQFWPNYGMESSVHKRHKILIESFHQMGGGETMICAFNGCLLFVCIFWDGSSSMGMPMSEKTNA